MAVPVTAALGIEQGPLSPSDQVAMLGIGSGLNVVMLGVDWRTSPVAIADEAALGAAG